MAPTSATPPSSALTHTCAPRATSALKLTSATSCETKKGHARPRLQGQIHLYLPRRRRYRCRQQHRRRSHHVQLRWRAQAHHHHRRQRLRWLRLYPGRAYQPSASWGVRWRGLMHHVNAVLAGCARHRPQSQQVTKPARGMRAARRKILAIHILVPHVPILGEADERPRFFDAKQRTSNPPLIRYTMQLGHSSTEYLCISAQDLPGQQEHILVVDDESAVRTVLVSLLESSGYDVSAASNLEQALAPSPRRPRLPTCPH